MMKIKEIKYPKLLLLLLTFIFAYILFYGKTYQPFHDFLISLGYIGAFISGVLFTYGFTAAPATAILLILSKEQNIFLAGIIAGFGSLVGDLIIFSMIRYSFADEIEKLSRERGLIAIHKKISEKTPSLFRRYLGKYITTILAGFIIASPLPDEIGVSLLASSRVISIKKFSLISYFLNTAGIFAILFLGKSI
ncbi:MAG: hypothetical protein QW802_00985 [Candidatus Altiarchaeota archaeon]